MSLVNEMLRDLDRRRRVPGSFVGGTSAAEDGEGLAIGKNSVYF